VLTPCRFSGAPPPGRPEPAGAGPGHQARGILICVAALPDGLAFRDRVLETQWSARTRWATCPGTLDVFDLADVDMDRLIATATR